MGETTSRGMNTDDAARHMGISRETFRTHVAPDIRPAKIGKRVIWLREDLDAWLDRAVGKHTDEQRRSFSNPLDACL